MCLGVLCQCIFTRNGQQRSHWKWKLSAASSIYYITHDLKASIQEKKTNNEKISVMLKINEVYPQKECKSSNTAQANDSTVSLIIPSASQSCSSVMTRVGVKRTMCSCVGFASSPFSFSFKQTFQASKSERRNLKQNDYHRIKCQPKHFCSIGKCMKSRHMKQWWQIFCRYCLVTFWINQWDRIHFTISYSLKMEVIKFLPEMKHQFPTERAQKWDTFTSGALKPHNFW